MFLISAFADNIKIISSCVTGVVAVCTGYVYFDGPIPASRSYVSSQLDPVKLAQNTQSKSIDQFLLYQQQEALRKAKEDPAAATSPTVKERIRELERIIKDTEARVNK